MTHICVGNLNIIASDKGLSPDRRQAITWTNVGILLIGPLGTNFNDILIKIGTCSFTKMHLKTSSAILFRPQCVKTSTNWQPFCRSKCIFLQTASVVFLFYIWIGNEQSSVLTWRVQDMRTLSHYWPFVRGIFPSRFRTQRACYVDFDVFSLVNINKRLNTQLPVNQNRTGKICFKTKALTDHFVLQPTVPFQTVA